jgi:hypothetical protein
MKRILSILIVLCLSATAGASIQSLGYWNIGDPGTTHEFWDFTPGYVVASGSGYTADPEQVFNPYPNRVAATITPIAGLWDGVTSISGSPGIMVALEIPNYDVLNQEKIAWVDVGNLLVSGVTVSATDGGSTTFSYTILAGQGNANFGVLIQPNPYVEKINFFVSAASGPAILDYIDVDTICTPEPTTICLLGIGLTALLRKRS